jgi:hypothetical protein
LTRQLNARSKPFFRNSKIRNLLISIVALSFIWPLQFLSKIFQPESVDASWMIALSEAWQQQWVFGNDIVFTYGPLSFLSTRVLLHDSVWPLICFDIFFAGSFIYIIYKILEEKYTNTRALLILLTCFLFKQAMFLSLVFTLQFLVLLYLNAYKKEQKIWLLLHAIITTTLIFYIKFNLAFISIAIFILFVTQLGISKDILIRKAAGAVLLLFISIFLTSLLLPVYLSTYIHAGIQLIYSYNDAVYVYPSTLLNQALAVITAVIFFAIVYVAAIGIRNKSIAEKIVALIFIILAFIIFKQSYVRADIEHLKDFFYVLPALLIIYMYISGSTHKLIHASLLLLWSTSIFISSYIYKDYFYPVKKVAAFPSYFNTMYAGFNYYDQLSKETLSENIKREIGTSTVDIIPWEASVLILNKLNYNPRPVIQSYQAYNQTLDEINAENYNSTAAPEYVIYGTNSIDRHYHFFDDTQLKEALYKNYYMIDTFNCNKEEMILFKRKKISLPIDFVKASSGEKNIEEVMNIPGVKYPLMIKIKLKYSLIGELQKLMLRAPYSEILITQQRGTIDTFQVATSILAGGVFIDHFINNREDAIDYFKGTTGERNRVKSIQIKTGNDVCWQNKWQYELYELR